MPIIIYTTHARERMALRGITEEMVAETLVDPDQTGTGYQARHLAYRRYRNVT